MGHLGGGMRGFRGVGLVTVTSVYVWGIGIVGLVGRDGGERCHFWQMIFRVE